MFLILLLAHNSVRVFIFFLLIRRSSLYTIYKTFFPVSLLNFKVKSNVIFFFRILYNINIISVNYIEAEKKFEMLSFNYNTSIVFR